MEVFLKMKKVLFLFVVLFLLSVSVSFASEEEIIKLPDPEKSGGIGVLDAISKRKSSDDFEDVEITLQELSTLLWAASGVNRDDGKLTFATAMNLQDMILFVFTREGTCRYNPKDNSLTLISKGDNRAVIGGQPFTKKAAVNLLYVQDTEKWPKNIPVTDDVILNCGFSHAGLSMQNVYLYAASKGWGAKTIMSFNHENLKKHLGLNENHNLTLMQCVGPEH